MQLKRNAKAASVIIFFGLLTVSYQNCSQSMSFATDPTVSAKAAVLAGGTDNADPGVVSLPPDPLTSVADGNSGSTTPPVTTPEPTDFDQAGNPIAISCVSGADEDISDLNSSALDSAPVVVVPSASSVVNVSMASLVQITGASAGVAIKQAANISDLRNISGNLLFARARSLSGLSNIAVGNVTLRAIRMDVAQGIVGTNSASISADQLGQVQNNNVNHLCVSGHTIGNISNNFAKIIKLRGVKHGSEEAVTSVVSDYGGLVTVEGMNIVNIQRINGTVILRNSKVTSIQGLQGTLVLINSQVGSIMGSNGPIYKKNSSIGSNDSAWPTIIEMN